jgi:hypothetical protein
MRLFLPLFLSAILLCVVSASRLGNLKNQHCSGHWVRFHLNRCSDPDLLAPTILAADGKAKFVPASVPQSICSEGAA